MVVRLVGCDGPRNIECTEDGSRDGEQVSARDASDHGGPFLQNETLLIWTNKTSPAKDTSPAGLILTGAKAPVASRGLKTWQWFAYSWRGITSAESTRH